jgi:hypothetical protein
MRGGFDAHPDAREPAPDRAAATFAPQELFVPQAVGAKRRAAQTAAGALVTLLAAIVWLLAGR